ncbi:hypothetical protein KUV26_03795 [Leisingera daeponensis]|uniref:Uncharacterized protein n=1 Tax=Leisingera daeponensis TaxID=405746 RepID=A0ABS7NCS6_9RHOB|nr:hypothetical protein [Leisingera daeponensis]MBY6138549.1 hypothetical protein [Leisingera daeponensis]
MQDMNNTARQIVGSPEHYLDDTSLFTQAWAAMKAARGQGFDPARLRAAHLIDHPEPAPEPTDQTLARVGAKVRALIAEKNIPLHRRNAA